LTILSVGMLCVLAILLRSHRRSCSAA
jgi:hypothetical protein